MTWTYNTALTATKDQVRFTIGDTDTNAQLVQDEEIAWAITQEATMWGAAARCCESISRNFLRKADVRIGRGGTTLTYTTAAKQYADMAKELRARANAMHSPWSGGLTQAEKDNLAGDASLVQPLFTKTMFQNPLVGQTNDTLLDTGSA